MVVSTWPFLNVGRVAWRVAGSEFSMVDALGVGCSAYEELQCDKTSEN